MIDFDEAVKNQEETQYKEIKQSTRTQAQKLRALRDEFGTKQPPPQNIDETDSE